MPHRPLPSRRLVLSGVAATLLGPPAVAASKLRPTPRQSEGPFYPDSFPDDVDADLLKAGDQPATALGQPLELTGRVLDTAGRPLRHAIVEIWQADANGRYIHSRSRGAASDRGFQGYGRVATGDDGSYRFRTIRPVAYPGRTPHIHFAVRPQGGEPLTTQMYVADEPGNDRDYLLNAVRPAEDRALLMVALEASGEAANRWRGVFDVVLG